MILNFSLIAIFILGGNLNLGKSEDSEVASYLNYETSLFLEGPLLHDVQTLKIFAHSVHFLRLKLLRPQKEILKDYSDLQISKYPLDQRSSVLKEFVGKHFVNESGLEAWVPTDWNPSPSFCDHIKDEKVSKLIKELNNNWLKYGRKLKDDVIQNPKLYSLLPLPWPFFVSNENQHELCIWDSYWIVEGLLACGMMDSARGVIENCINIIKEVGHCPPCSRVYFQKRNSLPVLPLMMSAYLNRSNDMTLIRKHINLLENDFHQWFSQRIAIIKNPFHVFLIAVEDTWPQLRPESYNEDLENWQWPKDELLMSNIFWDSNPVVKVASVKLTALTEFAARILADWARIFNHKAQAEILMNISKELNYTLAHLLKTGDCWQDLQLDNGFKPATCYSLTPVWTGLAETGCTRVHLEPKSGPEAIICGQYENWISKMSSAKSYPDLMESAILLHMISKHPKRMHVSSNIETTSRKRSLSIIIKLMCLIGLIKIFLVLSDRTHRE